MLAQLSPLTHALVAGFLVVLTHGAAAYLTEYIFKTEKFSFGIVYPSIEFVFILVLDTVGYLFSSPRKQKNSYHSIGTLRYCLFGIMVVAGYVLSHTALSYIDYITKEVCRSLKPVAIALVGQLIFKNKPSTDQYIAAILVVVALVLMCLADAGRVSVSVQAFGLFLALGSVLGDALNVNIIDNTLNEKKGDPTLLRLFGYLSALIMCIFMSVWSGEIFEAMDFISVKPQIVSLIAFECVLNYLGLLAIYSLSSRFSGTQTTIIISIRRVVTILVSLFAFGKPCNIYHGFGVALYFIALGIGMRKHHATGKKVDFVELGDDQEDRPAKSTTASGLQRRSGKGKR